MGNNNNWQSRVIPSWREVKEPQEVSIQEYVSLAKSFADKIYMMPVPGKYLGILHGAVQLASRHPGVKAMSMETQFALMEFVEWCNCVMHEWGFNNEQIAWLNRASWNRETGKEELAP